MADGRQPASSGAPPGPRVQPPELRGDLIHRDALVRRVIRGMRGRRCTALIAPAGYGKTTALAAAGEGLNGVRCAWARLEDGDDDPLRFWTLLARALAHADVVGAGIVPDHGRGVGGARDRVAQAWETVDLVLGAVADSGLEVVLILDDLQRVSSPRVLEQLRSVLEHAPPELHLAIGSRREPALPLARLRGRGELAEFRLPDLAFTYEETRALSAAHGVELSDDDLRAVHARTRGWPAGVRLALSTLAGADSGEERTDRARALARSERHMRELLADEVLARLDDGDREFLLGVAVLDELTPSVCRAMTGREDAGAVLDRLYRSGAVLMSRREDTDDGFVYRLHPVFSSLLEDRLRRRNPEALRAQHRKAARAVGGGTRRLEHLAASDTEALAEGLVAEGETLLHEGRAEDVLGWIGELPDEIRDSRPSLLLLAGRALWQVGDHARAWPILERAADGFRAAGEADREAEALVASADSAILAGEVDRAARHVDEALDRSLTPGLRARALTVRLRVAQFVGPGDVEEAAEDAVGEARRHPRPGVLRDTARALWMGVAVAPGGLDLLEDFCDVAWPVVGGADPLTRASLLSLSATVALYRGDPDRAAREAEAALQVWDRMSLSPPIQAQSVRLLAVLAHTARGDQAELDRWLPRLRAGADAIALSAVKLSTGLAEARVRWLREDARAVRAVLHGLPDVGGLAAVLRRTVEGMSALLDGDDDTAIEALGDAADREQRTDRRNLFAAPGVLLASVHAGRGEDARALEAGLPTLDACARSSCPGRILIEGARALPLLGLAAEAGIHPRMVRSLGERLGAAVIGPRTVPATGETLTRRQVEVLRLVAGGATNREIADRLGIGTETVKTHVSRILRKLDASTRTAAATRAREIGVTPRSRGQ